METEKAESFIRVRPSDKERMRKIAFDLDCSYPEVIALLLSAYSQ